MSQSTWAIYQRFDGQPTTVRYSHLTEQQADDEVDRLNAHMQERGLPAVFWSEQHNPESVFVIG